MNLRSKYFRFQPGWVALLLLLCLGVGAPGGFSAQAAGDVEFTQNAIELDFPNTLTFKVSASAAENIVALALEYGTNALSCVRAVARQPVEIVAGKTVSASWTWDFIDSGSLPMGAQVWWEWEVTLASGIVVRSEHQLSTLIDQRYAWEQTGADPADPTAVNVWYHEVSPFFANWLAQTGQKALQRMQTDFGFIPSRPVQVILYNNNIEVMDSGLYFTEWVGGYASPDYGVVVVGVEEGDYAWGEEVITHEFGHLVSGDLTHNCLAVTMPTWLSEGFSMYAEGGVAPREQDKVKQALKTGTLPPLRTLAAGFSANSAQAALSYAQSGMVFDFLFQEYGGEKVMALFLALQSGTLAEEALRQVYALDVDGLDNAWRASLGFAGETAPPTPTGTSLPSAVPTLPLLAPYDPSPTPSPTQVPPTSTITPAPTASPVPEAAPPTAADDEGGFALPCPGSSAVLLGFSLAIVIPQARRRGRAR